ncbi:hypothetical protein ACQ4PT_053853 [Festuca glaucescens]
MKRARSSEVFLGGRGRARGRLAPLLALAAFAYLMFVSVKLVGLGGWDDVSPPDTTATAGGESLLQRGPLEPPPRGRRAAAAATVAAGYGRITGKILRRHEALGGARRRWGLRGNFSELESMAAEAWARGAEAWEEAAAFSGDVDSILSGDGWSGDCPGSLALGGGERETAAFLPCGLAVGSAVTLVGTARAARAEYVEALERSGNGNGTVMVAQFAVELRGLRASDGEDPPMILHLNPRLQGDWSRRPVLEMNTCFRMQWGKAQRCDGTPSKDDDRVDGFPKCEKWERTGTVDSKEMKSASWFNRFIGRAKKPEMSWPYPFLEGKMFVLTIQAGVEGYHINVGGRHVASFPHRMSHRKEINAALKKEAEYFGDIVILPFIDRYELVVLKTIAICQYGVQNVTAEYIMKCDDDTFVRLDIVLQQISTFNRTLPLYLGNLNLLHRPLRYGHLVQEWPELVYPPYANGPGYVISANIARDIVSCHANQSLRLFKMEDVSMGMWVEDYNTTTTSAPVQYVHSWRFCQYGCVDNYFTAHYQSPRQMLCLWEKLSLGHAQCCNYR